MAARTSGSGGRKPTPAGQPANQLVRLSARTQSGELLAEEDVDEGVVLAGVVGVDGDLDG